MQEKMAGADPDTVPIVLTVEEAARLSRVSRGVVYDLVRSGTIPSVRVGRSLRIPREGLVRFLEGGLRLERGDGRSDEATRRR